MRMRAVSHLITRQLRLPPVTTPKVRVERDLAVPMRDGVVLKADRYAPAGDQRAPLVLCRSPYGRGGLVGAALLGWPLAERGFQVLVVSTRGTAGSGGTLDPYACPARLRPGTPLALPLRRPPTPPPLTAYWRRLEAAR